MPTLLVLPIFPVHAGIDATASTCVRPEKPCYWSRATHHVDADLFAGPLYTNAHGQRCAPGEACDFTPLPESVICTMGSDGGQIGAIPCP